MAFDNEKSVELIRVSKNSRGDYIIVNQIFDAGSNEFKCIDIRQYYTDGNDELSPTKKGVRITPDQFRQMKDALNSVEV